MATLLIYPGTKGAPVALQDVLREAHEAGRVSRAGQIAERQRKRIPLDDSTDWQAVDDVAGSIAALAKSRSSAALALEARRLADLTDGNELEPIGDYVPVPDLDGITVTMQVVADSDRRMWGAQMQAQWQAVRDARVKGDPVASQAALNEIDRIGERMVCAVVVDIGGVDGLKPAIAESIPGLAQVGLTGPLFQAARYFLELPAGKAVRCGLQPLST
jgi:hypothetical protein